jgi:glycopeptide antibiotics resistance protein
MVNVATGLTLGFFLTGALGNARRRAGVAVTALIVAGASAVLGTILEGIQVLSPTRQSEWLDVLGQVVGAVLGFMSYRAAGERGIRYVRALTCEDTAPLLAARFLRLFLPIYLLIQLTPLLPADLAARYQERSPWGPLAVHFDPTYPVLRSLAIQVLMNIPIGALAVLGWRRSARRGGAGLAVLLGVAIMSAVEAGQGLIWSRYPGVTDLLAGILGVAIGAGSAAAWTRPRAGRDARRSPLDRRWLLLAAGMWVVAVMVDRWHPFDFQWTGDFAAARYAIVQLVPFKSYYPGYATAPLLGLHEIVGRWLTSVPLGLLLGVAFGEDKSRAAFWSALAAATLAFTTIQVGLLFLPIRHEFPDVTDVITGVAGTAIGYAAGAMLVRVRASGGQHRSRTAPALSLDAPST